MKKLIQVSTLILIISGLVLSYPLLREQTLLIWLHILLAFAYSVLFLLFTFDHLSTNRNRIFAPTFKSLAGNAQIVLGLIVLISGFIIYLYGSMVISPWSEIHFWSTLAFIASSAIHFLKK